MSKKYQVDLNFDKEGISPQHFINREKQLEGGGFGEYTPAQFSVRIIMNAVAGGHPKGNIQSLRRTLRLNELLAKASQNGGIASLEEDDLKYIKSSFDKCSDWNNSVDTATIINRVYSTLEQAKEI